MNYSEQEIENLKEHNKTLKSVFWVWPLFFFILGLIIAALAYKFTIAG